MMKSKPLPFLKYGLAAALGALAMWLLLREPVVVGIAGFVLGGLMAAIVVERDAPAEMVEAQEASLAVARPVRTLIVGAGTVGQALATSLEAHGRCTVVGFVDDDPALQAAPWQVLGTRENTAELVRRYGVDEVILAYAPTWQQRMAEELLASHPGLTVRVVPSPYEAMMKTGAVESFGDIAVVQLIQRGSGFRDTAKRTFDLLTAVVGLVLFAPLMALAALLIRLSSPGPVIFRQERVGRGGVPFTLYKFRTMVPDAERQTGPVLAAGKDDERLTGVGRWLRLFRLDELPQLWNVLRGDMSLVGPRPERPHFVGEFARRTPSYSLRHRVRPGITGLAQVYGGYHTDARDKLRFDLIYVSHQSLWLDLCILARTLLVVLRPR